MLEVPEASTGDGKEDGAERGSLDICLLLRSPSASATGCCQRQDAGQLAFV